MLKNITLTGKIQQFNFELNTKDSTDEQIIIECTSTQKGSDIICPFCGGSVHIYDNSEVNLKDMPVSPEIRKDIRGHFHRYRCQECLRSFSENIFQTSEYLCNRTCSQLNKPGEMVHPDRTDGAT